MKGLTGFAFLVAAVVVGTFIYGLVGAKKG
jgi:hypothetical protein